MGKAPRPLLDCTKSIRVRLYGAVLGNHKVSLTVLFDRWFNVTESICPISV